MNQVTCPGLPADWINAWLAAVGATVLDPRLRLCWSTDGAATAILSAVDIDPVDCLVESWPNRAMLSDLPIAREWRGARDLPRNVPVEEFKARARNARGHPKAWTLSSTLTDLSVDENGKVAHAPFYPPAPRGLTLHDRLLRIHKQVELSRTRITDSLTGRAERVKGNGLGFDLTRLGSQGDNTTKKGKWVDPVVETLAFFGLAILPVRGRGADRGRDPSANTGVRQRGWPRAPRRRASSAFRWPAWRQPLDRAGIDALLDIWRPDEKRSWEQVGVYAGWLTTAFEPSNRSDPTRGFGSERL